MAVKIGADTSAFDRSINNAQSQVSNFGTEIKNSTSQISSSMTGISDSTKEMAAKMREAYAKQTESLRGFREEQQAVKYGYFELAQSSGEYAGKTNEFMGELLKLGKRHKAVTDGMLKNNEMAKTSFIQSIGTIMARSTQSEKIAQNFTRMGNPLYSVNNQLLKVSGNMEAIAKRGTPAALALQQLGPNANMKDLQDMTRLIGMGLMRMTMLTLGAGIAFGIMTGKLIEASMAMDEKLAKSVENMNKTWGKAFEPLVKIFAEFMKIFVSISTFFGNMVNKFNEANPVLAGMIQSFGYLFVALLVILSPLAIGIGLTGGLTAAFSALWMVISPFVIAFATVAGTAAIVAAAIVAVGAALYLLWTKTTWFKTAVLSVWNGIKSATVATWNYIYTNGIKPAIDAISTYVLVTMTKLSAFWYEHGDTIKKILSVAFSIIKSIFTVHLAWIVMVFKTTFIAVKTAVSVAFQAIKLVIDLVLNNIMAVFGVFFKLLKGDWRGALSIVKETTVKNFEAIVDFVKGLGKTFYNAGKGLIDMMAKGIKNAAGKVLTEMKDIAKKARDFLPFSPAKVGPLSDLDKLDFGNPIADSITKATPTIQSMMGDMLNLPEINPSVIGSESGNSNNQAPVNIELNYHGNGNPEDAYTMLDILKREMQKDYSRGLRTVGVKG
jgi:phage-related protein